MPPLTRSQTKAKDRKAGESLLAYEERLAAFIQEATDRAAAAAKERSQIEQAEEAKRQKEEQDRLRQEEADLQAAAEHRSRQRERLFTRETVIIDETAHWVETQVQAAATVTPAASSSRRPPKLDDIPIFCDQSKTEPIPWWRQFTLRIDMHHVPNNDRHPCLYHRSGGACQAWLDNILTSHGVAVYLEDGAGAMAPQVAGADGTWHAMPVGLLLHADLSLLHVRAGLSQQFPVLPDESGRASGIDVGWSWEEKISEDTAFPSTVVQLEWSHADRRVHRSVVGELDVGEAVNPIFLVRTDECTKHHLSGLMCSLRLPVCLWMPSRTWLHLRAGLLHECSPKCRHEAGVAVADYVFRYTMAANPVGVEEACQLGSRGVVLAREKTRVLTQSVHDREDVVVSEAVAGEWSGDIHGNGETGFLRDRHRA
uniref:Uncharacterized protein n=1 Tax=Chara braunii TaxID=69332 RepID=A0A388KZ23_CHABU